LADIDARFWFVLRLATTCLHRDHVLLAWNFAGWVDSELNAVSDGSRPSVVVLRVQDEIFYVVIVRLLARRPGGGVALGARVGELGSGEMVWPLQRAIAKHSIRVAFVVLEPLLVSAGFAHAAESSGDREGSYADLVASVGVSWS
jgi:hypothetical protein